MSKPTPRRRWLVTASAAVAAGSAVLAIGPAAPWLVDQFADGQRAWRLGRIQVDGVSGAWLGALRAARISISDENGVWLEARDVSIDWRPQEILFGSVALDRIGVGTLSVARQPQLAPATPPSKASWNVEIGALRVETIALAQDVVGVSAQFNADLALRMHAKSIASLSLQLRRTDSDADHALVEYRAGDEYLLRADVEGAPRGVFATALGVPGARVKAQAQGAGSNGSGQTHYSATIGEGSFLDGGAQWDPARWSLESRARLDLLPALQALARRIGVNVEFTAQGAEAGAFSAHVETNFLTVDASGTRDARDALEGVAQFTAVTRRISDIARESPFPLGAATLSGEIRRARGTIAIQGSLQNAEVEAFGRATTFSGPVEAALTAESFRLSTELAAPPNAPALFSNARIFSRFSYDRTRQRFELQQAELQGDAVAFDAQGWARRSDGELSGAWEVRRLETLLPDVVGAAAGRWRAFTEAYGNERVWATTADGVGARVGGRGVLAQLLGQAPRLDARLRYEKHGITVSHARIDGVRGRAGAAGRVVSGNADLALEMTARGPLTIGGAEITGAGDATGRLAGRLSRPALTARAQLSSFAAGGVTLEHPIVDLSIAPQGSEYAGRASVQAMASSQALNGGADVSIAERELVLTNVDAQWGALAMQGSASFTPAGVTADLDLNGGLDGLAPGLSGRIAGALALTPESTRLDAQLADARAGELYVRAATVHAEGPRDAISARFNLRGRLRRAPLVFAGAATLDTRSGAALRIDGRGTLAEADIFTRAPIEARFDKQGSEIMLNVAVGDGAVVSAWRDRRRRLEGSARIEDAPLAPLAAIWGETASGRIDGRINLASSGSGLDGDLDLTLNGARFAGRQRGALDMHIVGALDPGRLQTTIDAVSSDGMSARFEADAPVVTSAAPIRIALAENRRGRAAWSVHGPAATLWAAARLQDQSLDGQIDGAGELSFGAGHLSGDGHLTIANGRFEDKLTGVSLENLEARVALSESGVAIEHFSARGPHGGTLTARGGSTSASQGNIAVSIDNLRIADRPDARATASGDLALAWGGGRSSLTGQLAVAQADIDISASPNAGIPTLDVVEVNRPGGDDLLEEEEAPARIDGSTDIDIRLTAPGRVFTRGRGVDAEWSLDMRLDGTAREPRIYGEARSVRGTLALSGQPFDIDDARIMFNGDPLDAQIDLSATRDTADLTARVRLTGTARDPEIAFSSDPPLPEDEILPQVLFGHSVQDLSAFEAAQLAASLAALSGRASLDLMDAARAAAGLDRLNVRQDQTGGFLVAGGVYLTRDVYVELARTGLGQAQTRVEWTVRPRLVLVTSFLGNGDQRVSLRWRRESD